MKPFCWGIIAILILTGCKHEVPSSVRSAYYWSTTWECDSMTLDFLRTNDIQKLYLRFFDVVLDESNQINPNATVRFASPMPDSIEVVPTVYIVNSCMGRDVDNLDQLIFKRVMQMCETHDVLNVKEIQIDCDWSPRTHDTYFAFLNRLRSAAHDKGLRLSVTIRLHQLAEAPPPVDHGVLMMYNTGDVHDINKNPILELDDVAPYLRHLSSYSIPLSTAYPVFSWDLLYRDNNFVGILHGDDLPIIEGDTIITREVPLETVMKTKEAVRQHKKDANSEVILFDISKNNIKRIKQHNYEKVYSN